MNRRTEIRFASLATWLATFLATLTLALLLGAGTAQAQTTSFTYQGRLNDGGNPANGTYDFQFKLFDLLAAGTQLGAGTLEDVVVSSGVFTVTLDFGAAAFPGADRFLDIGVRPGPSIGAFTTLTPRLLVTATPYTIKSLNASSADALSAACVGCVPNAQISGLAGSKITGAIPVAGVPAGSANYIQNTTVQQAASNFNISGNGTLGGNLTVTTGTLSGNGSGLTNLSAANIAAGTLPIARGGTGITSSPSAAGQFLRSSGAGAWAVTGLAASDLPSGNGNYIQNTTVQQAASNFSISGNGLIGGNAGIGIASPLAKLDIGGHAALNDFMLRLRIGSDANHGLLYSSVADGPEFRAFGGFIWKNGAGGATERMRLTAAGNLGIGAPTPARRLHVQDGSGAGGNGAVIQIGAQALGADPKLVSFGDTCGGNGCVYLGEEDADDRMVLRAGLIRIKNASVEPETHLTQDLGGPMNHWRFVYIQNFITPSDARLKEGVTNLRYGLHELLQLRPVTFLWKDRRDGRTNLGLIAQEVEKVLPEVVERSADPAAPLGMNYTGLLPVMIKAIQEQQAALASLQVENAALKGQNENLQLHNAALAGRLTALEQTMLKLLERQSDKADGAAQAQRSPQANKPDGRQ